MVRRLPAALAALAFALPPAWAGNTVDDARRTLVGPTDAFTRKDAAASLGRVNEKPAVDALLDGFRAVEARIALLLPEKGKLLDDLDKFDLGKKLRPMPAPAAKPGGAARPGSPPPGGFVMDGGQFQKWQELQQRAKDIEERIMAEEAVRRAIIEALAATSQRAAVERLLAEVRSGSASVLVRAGVCEALASVGGDGVVEAIAERLVKDSDVRVRIAAATALRVRQPAPSLAPLLPGLQDKDWRVRSEIVRALGAYKVSDCARVLVDAMEREDGRLRNEVRDSLKKVTGVDKGDDPQTWKVWWQNQATKGAAANVGTAPIERAPLYYGLPVASKRVIFILDHSGSMVEPAAYQGTFTEAAPPPDAKKEALPPLPSRPPGERKWDVAVWELSRVIHRLPPDAAFNIVCFDHDYVMWQPHMQKASTAAKKGALDFLKGVQPGGLTNIFDPLERAFGICAGGLTKQGVEEVDAIFLVTDGVPNLGQIPDPDKMVEKVREMNRFRRVAVHTVWVGIKPGVARPAAPNGAPAPDPDKEREQGEKFLRALAEQNGGTFVSRSGPPTEKEKKDSEAAKKDKPDASDPSDAPDSKAGAGGDDGDKQDGKKPGRRRAKKEGQDPPKPEDGGGNKAGAF